MKRGIFLAVLIAGALAGCGDDSEQQGDTRTTPQISDPALRKNLTVALGSSNPSNTCKLYDKRLLREVYRTESKCVSSVTEDRDTLRLLELKETVTPLSAEVSGNTARVKVSVEQNGFAFDGHVRMRKADGQWLLAEFEQDLLLNSYTDDALLRALDTVIPGSYSPANQRCYAKPYQAMSDAELRAFDFAVARGDEPEVSQDLDNLSDCVEETDGGVSFKRAVAEVGIRLELREGGLKQPIIECALEQLRRRVPDKRLEQIYADESEELAGELSVVLQSCGGSIF